MQILLFFSGVADDSVILTHDATSRGSTLLQWREMVLYSLWKVRYIPEKFIVASRVLMMADAPVVATPISLSLSPNNSPNDGSMERVASWKTYW